jgi:Uma2 family endonuclease
MTVAHRLDAAAYGRLVAGGGLDRTELRDGLLVEKPVVSVAHVRLIDRLARQLHLATDPDAFVVSTGGSRLRIGAGSFAVPDLVVLAAASEARLFADDPLALAAYDDPAALVVEVWSPSTGGYDLEAKIPGYMARGDAEIWRLHPLERTVVRWVRQPDGRYEEVRASAGRIELAALPGVAVDLAALFR